MEALSWMWHVESGLFHYESGLPGAKLIATHMRLPLREFANAMGLAADWDASTKTATIAGRRIVAVLQPDEHRMVVNGRGIEGVEIWFADGRTQVRPWVIAKLLAERYSSGEKKAMSDFVETLRRGPPEMRAQSAPRVP